MDDIVMITRRIVITGACGFTGDHACQRFKEAGWEVIAIVSPRATRCEIRAAVHVESCELTDGDAVLRLMKRIEPNAILHLAGRNAVDFSWREPAATLSINFMATVHVLEGVRALGSPCRVLVVGSMLRMLSDGWKQAAHPYAFSKSLQVAAAKAWHHWYGVEAMIAEPSNLIGPGRNEGLCGKIARWTVSAEESGGKITPFTLSSLHEARDFLDVRDAVAAYELVLNDGEPGESYAVESGAFRTLGEIRTVFDQASSGTVLPWVIGQTPQSASPMARDTSLIRNLGWKPVYSFQQSIEDALTVERELRRRERSVFPSDKNQK